MTEPRKYTLTENQKNKIRKKYKGIDSSLIDVIPCISQDDFYNDISPKRVAVYARVSTDGITQTSSFELQKNHYEDMINKRPNWTLVNIYADEGISGTSLQHRDSFKDLIQDCKNGKIDLIITKSVSRFSRNIVDCIEHARMLRALTPPVAIFFETEGIYTLNPDYEMSLAFISTMAQEESHTKSKIMERSIDMRFGRGLFLTPVLLGYDHDEDGNLVINKEEAKTVRLIFFMYLYGFSTRQIANQLNALKRPTKNNNISWSSASVLNILKNERRCGDILARKTFTPNFLDHKAKKNAGERTKYFQKDHHEGIISRDDFLAVQRMLRNSKYGHKGFLPELNVISDGALKGFVSINPRWAGFKAEDYKAASNSVLNNNPLNETSSITVNDGAFNLLGFEVVRSQFLSFTNKVNLTITPHTIKFSAESLKKLNTHFVELFVNPSLGLLIAKPAVDTDRNALMWSRFMNGKRQPKTIAGTAFLPNLYNLFGWDINYKYRLTGNKHTCGKDEFLIFDTTSIEILISTSDTYITHKLLNKSNTDISMLFNESGYKLIAYPQEWDTHFGNTYYSHVYANEVFNGKVLSDENVHYNPEPLNVTPQDEVATTITTLLDTMKETS